jgi:hypothetical protein
MVLVQALNDTTVRPHERCVIVALIYFVIVTMIIIYSIFQLYYLMHSSSQFGYWVWGRPGQVQLMRDTQGYQGNWLGLKTMDADGKIVELSYMGPHWPNKQWPQKFWGEEVLPFLNN